MSLIPLKQIQLGDYDGGTGGLLEGEAARVSADRTAVKADASARATALPFVGIAREDIPVSETGRVASSDDVTAKFITGLTLLAGDKAFLSTTAGRLTNDVSAFSTGNVVLPVGIVKDASNYGIDQTAEVELAIGPPVELE